MATPGLIGKIYKSIFGTGGSVRERGQRTEQVSGPAPSQVRRGQKRLRKAAEKRRIVLTAEDKWLYEGGYVSWRGISSNVDGASYDVNRKVLTVGFHGGKEGTSFYEYMLISEDEARDLWRAPSKGKWVWDRLRIRGTTLGHQKEYVFLSGPSTQKRQWNRSRGAAAAHAKKVSRESGLKSSYDRISGKRRVKDKRTGQVRDKTIWEILKETKKQPRPS